MISFRTSTIKKGRVNPAFTIMDNKLKLIIFDLDGTLVDAYEAIIDSFNYTMKKLGYPLQPKGLIRKAVGWGDKNLLKPYLRKKDLKKALQIYRKHHRTSLRKSVKLFQESKSILSKIKKSKIKTAVASNRPTVFSKIIIKTLGLARYFDYILCADRLKNIKPHPEIIKRIMARLKVKPSEALYVGDMAIDAQAGRNAGVKTIIVTTGSSSLREIKAEKPYKIIKRIGQISRFL